MTAKPALRVLVIDDSKEILDIMTALINSLGAIPTTAENAATGISLTETTLSAGAPFDLILLDIRMPEVDGFAAAQKIRAVGFKGKIAAFTANATMQGKKRGLEVGIDAYFSKSVLNKEVLGALLNEISDGKSAK